MNIFVLDRNYNKIGILSNEGANPQAPYFDDLYTQELDTGADTYYFSTLASYYAQDIIEIGNHVVFEFNNKQKMFVISSLEFEHKDGMNVIGVYAEGAGFELLEKYKKDIKLEQCNYAQLLDNILAGTGWRYKVSSSLSKNLQDVSYTTEKNVYALLQDSIQTFQGVELEFITDYRNGLPVKTIRAYGNGERGSFVGKRFEYGKNVKGIVKTQEVSNTKDEDVIFNEGLVIIDGLRVEITYDVDFALRSEEVTEINIGDTHYIIDNDFNPPMQIKGRIGKIEISFSDPTRNKIYLANFKKATGSKSNKTKEEDVKDIIDDYLDDKYGDGSDPADHDHFRLISREEDDYYTMVFGSLPGLNESGKTGNRTYFEFRDYDVMFSVSDEYKPDHWLEISLARGAEFVGSDFEPGAGNDDYHGAYIYNSSGDLIPNSNGLQDIGSENYHWRNLYVDNINGSPAGGIGGGEVDSITFSNGTRIVQASNGGINVEREDGDGTKLNVYGELYATEKIKCELGMEANTLNIKTIQFSDGTTLTSANGNGGDPGDGGLGIPEGVITYTEDPIPGNGYRLDFNADRTYVNDLLIANDGMNVIGDLNIQGNILLNGEPITGDSSGISDTVENLTVTDTLTVPKIKQPNGTNYIEIDGDVKFNGNVTGINNSDSSNGGCEACLSYTDEWSGKEYHRFAGALVPDSYIEDGVARPDMDSFIRLTGDALHFALRYQWSSDFHDIDAVFGFELEEDGGGATWGPGSMSAPVTLGSPNHNIGKPWKTLYVENSPIIESDIKYKENIIYLDDLLDTQTYSSTNEAETPFLDFIKNDFKPALYNYKPFSENEPIKQEDNQLGFIANDIVDTEVGGTFVYIFDEDEEQNLMISTNGYTTVVARALQEEIRTRDEKIANLEDRLAKIEEMLGINNN